ncbi:unnamed protein product [Blepharisma stoltei]|uniref:Aminotransferase class I/classII large domain-containing protein n=1 Tax=Blepharisma stoltei TaxID=1481888 RepID=A0AAU9J8Q9_9CILI|nr:unnamed protein product [Blepharisma stoltei]
MEDWTIGASDSAMNSHNPIYTVFNKIIPPAQFHKPVLSLVAGDPSKCSDFQVHPAFVEAVCDHLRSGKGNCYSHQHGSKEAREFMAQKYSYDNIKLTFEDIIFDFGGSGAIFTIVQSLLNPGDNILAPSPGYPLYESMCQNRGCEVKHYKLKPQENWEIDFNDLDALVDDRTKLLVVINPSNPCGSVFSRDHLLQILDWAKRHRICILADEVYEYLTFEKPFIPMGSLTDEVPVFAIGTMSKLCLVPGWRCGWIKIYDKYKRCGELRRGIENFKSLVAHAPHFMVNAIPQILTSMPEGYSAEVSQKLKQRADIVYQKLSGIPELTVIPTEGSIYSMILIDTNAFRDIPNSEVFAEKLAAEEGLMLLPAECFSSESGFRIVICNPIEVLEDSMDRIKEFVKRHKIANDVEDNN